ncbi:hypothetical protein KC19_9G185000 [Ceratodon purpureus]|uniref:Uncharacterized protein n=1 Tax=Ceratodon purpureus TaxID=3225 RepID=A0A8T0GX03_CERPU|nr:hypothetical protein KC19_9G185000 [Ceratodon purpureus]
MSELLRGLYWREQGSFRQLTNQSGHLRYRLTGALLQNCPEAHQHTLCHLVAHIQPPVSFDTFPLSACDCRIQKHHKRK